jgi:lipoteichoic acid synthase
MKDKIKQIIHHKYINDTKLLIKKNINQLRILSRNYIKTNILFSVFILTSLINASLLRFVTVMNFFDLHPIVADVAVLLIIGSFGYFIKPKHQFKYFFTFSIIITAICVINSMYYTNYLSFSSVSLFLTSFQVIDVGDAVLENVVQLRDFIYIWQIIVIFYVHKKLLSKKYYEKAAKIEKGKVRAFNTLIAGVILLGLFISTLNSVDIGRLNKQWNREFVVMKFGIFTYQLNDAMATLRSQISPMFGYDSNAKIFREYYENRVVNDKKNKYTNIFEGQNVLFIHAESIQTLALDVSFNDQPVAPFLRKLAKEGLYFSNFYAQESVGTSSDTEFTIATSLMPTTSGTVFINYFDREYVTIQSLLKDKGYETFSMHGNNRTFWNRNIMHKTLGYDKFYAYPEDYVLDESIGLGLSDMSFFNQSVPKIVDIAQDNQKFFGTMIMLTNHTPFSDIAKISTYEVDYKYEKYNELTKKNEIVSAPFMEGTKLGNYFKSVNYADQALEHLFNLLEEQGILDNTVVVIYGDHDAKLRRSEYTKFYNYDHENDTFYNIFDEEYVEFDAYDYELNRKVPLIIWSKNQRLKKEVTEVMGMYDVLPTIGNMLGIKSPYALGNDIFNTTENVVVFPNGNWLTNKIYYNAQKEEAITLKEGEVITPDYIEKYSKHAQEVVSISDSIIVYDLIKKSNETQTLIEEYGIDG